jgi:hypothetical protein
MKRILILFLVAVIIVAIALSAYFSNVYYYFKSLASERARYPSTYFIEPSNSFVACYKTDDCIKVKGTACPPSKGGAEICINKEHMQEYLSNIEILSGKEWEVECPNINNSTNKECSCINNVCKLVGE